MARRRTEPTPGYGTGARAVGEYALALAGDWSRVDLEALSDAELRAELRRAFDANPDTPGVRLALYKAMYPADRPLAPVAGDGPRA